MSEPARKTDIDIAEFERRLRPIAPRAEDPLAELARLVGGPPEPRKPAQPIDALSPQARSALTAEEELFLNELSLAVDRAPAARGPALADDPLARAHAAIGKVAAEARAAEAKARKPRARKPNASTSGATTSPAARRKSCNSPPPPSRRRPRRARAVDR
ncbi:MAG: hypothetical protein HZY79_13055 [Rhodoblastus sp.]|nr:MAG: hypothetical protein HZY79_13055 [Rhodoblastus sp.]